MNRISLLFIILLLLSSRLSSQRIWQQLKYYPPYDSTTVEHLRGAINTGQSIYLLLPYPSDTDIKLFYLTNTLSLNPDGFDFELSHCDVDTVLNGLSRINISSPEVLLTDKFLNSFSKIRLCDLYLSIFNSFGDFSKCRPSDYTSLIMSVLIWNDIFICQDDYSGYPVAERIKILCK